MDRPYQITFVPLPKNRSFNDGYAISLEYRLLESMDYALDFSELVINFTFCRITLRGSNLEELFNLIRAHTADRVEQTDATHAEAGNPLPFRVTAMGHEPM